MERPRLKVEMHSSSDERVPEIRGEGGCPRHRSGQDGQRGSAFRTLLRKERRLRCPVFGLMEFDLASGCWGAPQSSFLASPEANRVGHGNLIVFVIR